MGFKVGSVQKITEMKNHLKGKKKEVENNKDNDNKEHIKFKDILRKLIQ